MIGETISHYKILEKLGEGGMGVVYKAQDIKLDRTVALKFISPQSLKTDEEKTRFIQEAKAAAVINHPSVTTVYEINEVDRNTFISMEYIQGENLKDKIETGPLKIDEALKIAIQIAEGLQEAHDKGIVHRDIKSANIMITEKGQVKIMDFGLAQLKGQSKLTKAGTTVGTAAYMSPEQSMGKKVERRTDIWSLGVVLYEMVTGQLPFKGDYEQAVIYSILNEDPEPITSVRTGASPELERIINKALVKNPADRYQHADDLMVDLRKLKKDSQPDVSVSRKKTGPEITLKASRSILIFGIPILAIIIAGYFLFRPKPEKPAIDTGDKPSLAVVYFENKSGDKNLDNWRDAFSELLTTDLSQSRYLKVLRSDEIYSIFKKLNLLEVSKYSSENLREIAKNGGVNHILKGSYIKAGDNFVITAMLINAVSGETISSLSVRAESEKNIFPKVDELTREIKSKLKITRNQIANDLDKEVGTITTSSPEAYAHFLEGIRYDRKGDYWKVIEQMEKAVAVDPEFATAYRVMSNAYGNLLYSAEEKKYIIKAMELSSRLSDRERLLIQADYYTLSEKTFPQSIKALSSLLKLYPDDINVNNLMGVIQFTIGDYARAVEYYEAGRRAGSRDVVIYTNLASAYRLINRTDKAEEVLRSYINRISDSAVIRRSLAGIYRYKGAYDLALEEMKRANSLDPTNFSNHTQMFNIYFYSGHLAKAEEECNKLMESDEAVARTWCFHFKATMALLRGKFSMAKQFSNQIIKHLKKHNQKEWENFFLHQQARMELSAGNPERALAKLEEHWKCATENNQYAEQRKNLYLKARIYIALGALDKTRETADSYKKMIEQQLNKRIMSNYFHLLGLISHEKKLYSQAIDYYNQGLSLITVNSANQFTFANAKGAAFFEKREFKKALKQYEKLTRLPVARIDFADVYSRTLYRLGKIYEQMGFKGKAIDSYNKFIDLWKNCDPEFQYLVEDAQKRVKELEINP